MKKSILLLGLVVLSSGCSTMNNTEAGALGGGIFGGALGTLVGAATGHPLAGAAIGAGTGALAGGAIGNCEDRAERRHARAAAANAMTIDQVAQMARQGLSDAIIIQQINTTNSGFNLTPDQIDWLKQNRVSDQVILYMQARRPGMVAPASVMYVEPPPPPVAVGVGIGFGPHCHRRW